ncbi:MAG TPA: glycosyltransferase family 2 protein [Micromonosporaceae bacterium]|nr:glycosyltransferase family 2 protein [Micromonosporaceae bacterium]
MTDSVNRIVVIVPAHDEAATVSACLRSVKRAARRVSVAVDVVVVADACSDATAEIAGRFGAIVLDVDVRTVGRARAIGSAYALRDKVDGVWLAHTDADSSVPVDWLTEHLRLAAAGADVVAAPVDVDHWRDWPATLPPEYYRYYRDGQMREIPQIHGANLGIRGRAYQRIGGFPPLAVGEDQALFDAALSAGLTVTYQRHPVVRTSGRSIGRVVGGGFHEFLATMVTGRGNTVVAEVAAATDCP